MHGDYIEENNKSIAIIGDVCLNTSYILSPDHESEEKEGMFDTKPVQSFQCKEGWAANIAVDLKNLGVGTVDLYGLVGGDYHGCILLDLLRRHGIGTDGMITQKSDFMTNAFLSVYNGHSLVSHYAFGTVQQAEEENQDEILNLLEKKIKSYDVIIIKEATVHSLHTPYFIKKLNNLITAEPLHLWITDCKDLHTKYKKTIHTLSESKALYIARDITKAAEELGVAELSSFGNIENLDSASLIAFLYSYWKLPVVMTRGSDGVVCIDKTGIHFIKGVRTLADLDSSGVRSSFLSGFVFALIDGETVRNACEVGNYTLKASSQSEPEKDTSPTCSE